MTCIHLASLGKACTVILPALFLATSALAGAPSPQPEAAGPDTPERQMASLGSFRFESGETIDDLKVSYVTYGKLNAARDNAVLSLQHFTGDHHDNEFLIGPEKALDPEKYFIIATDFLANSKLRQDVTTGPTNSGLKMQFPRITARDWVNADYKLVKEYLGIDHVVAATGASIGGINAFQLAVSHPDFAAAVIPIAASAQINSQARMVLRHVRDVITLDPSWYGGMYDVNPATGLAVALMEMVPWLWSSQWFMNALTTSEKLRNYQASMQGIWRGLDARDIYYQLAGWSEFNVGDTPGFNGDAKAALAAIKAKALLIGIKDDQLFRREELQYAKNAIRDAAYLEVSSSVGHAAVVGHLDPKFDETINGEIAKFLATVK
jgi:homoserine O-acetyltransferase/O-succinyltransferase